MTSLNTIPRQDSRQDFVHVLSLTPENRLRDYQEAMDLAKKEAEKHFGEYMLMSWYDRDRDFESPQHTSECALDDKKEGYIHYGLSHGATLKVDIEAGRFVFFFAPVEW